MAKKKVRRKKKNRGSGFFSVVLFLLLAAGCYFYFFKNSSVEVDNNFDALMARIMKTETTPAATSPSPAVNTAESTPGVEPVTSASAEKLSTESPQETENIQETPVVIQQKGASIHVINYTGQKNLGEEIRTTLENYGFVVSSGNGSSLKHVSSAIIEKKENVSGEGEPRGVTFFANEADRKSVV